jgi:hypothetical protein
MDSDGESKQAVTDQEPNSTYSGDSFIHA